MVSYGETNSCRRAFLLGYFGEEWGEENCGACDVCLAKSVQVDAAHTYDGTKIGQKVLSAVIRTGERFGVNHVVDVLRGSRSQRVQQFRHDTLPVHGIARGFTKEELQDVVDQLIDKGLIARSTTGNFPTLFVTTKGKAFLKSGESLELVGQPPIADSGGEPDELLFEILRSLRQEIATELAVPAYVVFPDSSLRQMAVQLPTDDEALLRIKGVGENKLRQFGDRFVAVICEHSGERAGPDVSGNSNINSHATADSSLEQDRASSPRAYEKWQPEEDERLGRLFTAGRSIDEIAAKLGRQPSAIASRLRQTGMTTERRLYLSNTEAQTLELVRSGLNLAEVAARREIAPGTVLTHLERIAETDEALDLTHMLPPARRYARIVEAFRTEDDDYLLSPVKQRLGDDYSYEELRLVRLRLRQLSTNIALSSSKFDILSTGQNP